MNHFRVFDDKILYNFDFKGHYVGYVLDNSEFETSLKIKVFIPELFSYKYNPSIKNIDSNIELSTSNLINKDEFNITTKIRKQEYVYAKILVERDGITTRESFINHYKPNINDKVLVSFFNNNPNNCIYENKIFLTTGETLNIDDKSGLLNITPSNNTETKIIWKYN